jgi:FkbM family methyltransferase
MEIYKNILKKDALCFDIGANIGNKTETFMRYSDKVICVEPQPNCALNIKNRFGNNSNVIVVNKACGPKISKSVLFISNNFNTLSTMSESFIEKTKKERFNGVSWDSSIEVDVTTLDALIAEYGLPHFCKIDIEGYESEVLKGLSQAIPYVSVEFTPELKEKTFECMDILLKIDGDYLFNYSEGESDVFSFDKWLTYVEMKEFLLKNNDFRVSFGDLYAKK